MAVLLSRVIVRIAALTAPHGCREAFTREWLAELFHEADALTPMRKITHALGSFADAWTIRQLHRRAGARGGRMRVWIRSWLDDLRVAARSLRKVPAFSLVVVITLALGIGGATAIYTLLDRVVLDPLPYPDPDRLVEISNRVPGVGPDEVWRTTTAQQVFYAEHATSLASVGIYRALGENLQTPAGPTRVTGWRITASVFPMLGARAHLGRLIDAADDTPGAASVAVLSYELWRGEFGGDPTIVGTSILIYGNPFEVIGVLEPGIAPPIVPAGYAIDVWIPVKIDPQGEFWNNHQYDMIGRLAPGITLAGAEAELGRLKSRLSERFPKAYYQSFFERYGFHTQVIALQQAVVGDMTRNLWILFGAVLVLLAIACANVANLFVVRLEGRARELTIRSALGASRAALARYLFAEGLLLSTVGAGVAIAVGVAAGPALLSLAPLSFPRIESVRMDIGSVVFTGALALLIGAILGGYALLRHTDIDIGRLAGGRTATSGRHSQRMRSALVATQVALALTLVVGAGLLVESMRRLHSIDPGFEPSGVLTARLYLTSSNYQDDVEMWATYSQILERVRIIPGVTAAGMSEDVPVAGSYGCTVQGFEDRAVYDRIREAGMTTCAGQEPTTPGYFEALGIPILQGRPLTDADSYDPTRAAVVVSRAFAERFWPNSSAIGKGVAPNGRNDPPFYRVVGIVGDVPAESLDGEPAIAIYYPVVNAPGGWGSWRPSAMTLVVQTGRDDPSEILPDVRRAVHSVDATIPIVNPRAMSAIIGESMARFAFVSALLGTAAFMAIALAAVGVYGVVSYVVSGSTREIGMRVAIGARPSQVESLFIKRSLTVIGLGLLIGVGLALATTRLLEGLLFGVEATDPATFAIAGALLAAVAFGASWIPARRATRVDPVEALRAE